MIAFVIIMIVFRLQFDTCDFSVSRWRWTSVYGCWVRRCRSAVLDGFCDWKSVQCSVSRT